MKKLLLTLAFASMTCLAQYETILGSATVGASRPQLNLKPAIRSGVGAPSGACISTYDLYLRTDNDTFYGCKASAWVLIGSVGSGGITDPGSNGILSRTALNTVVSRTITGTANQVTVTNGDGVSGAPTLSFPANMTLPGTTTGTFSGNLTGNITGTAPAGTLTGTALNSTVVTSSLTSVGTIGSGTWQGTAVGAGFGGTGQTSATEDGLLIGNATAFALSVLPSCSNAISDKLLYNSTTNAFSCGTDQTSGGGSGITSLGGLTGASQTFVNDTNVTMVSSGTTHTLTWAGTLANARTTAASANTASAIVARDGSGNFVAGTITAALTGNASTSTALAANGTNCSAGQFPLGVDASGASESCTALPTTIAGTSNEISASASTGAITLSLPTAIDLGGKTSFEIPNAAAPTVSVFGQIAGDNNLWASGRGAVLHYDGTAATALIGVLVSDTPSNGQVPVWNTGGTITWESVVGSGDVTAASSFGTDNVMIRSDGTGKGVQSTGITIDDSNNISTPGTVTSGSGTTAGGGITLGNSTGDTAASFLEANSGDGASNTEPGYLKLWSSHTTKRQASIFPCTNVDGVLCVSSATPTADSTAAILVTGGALGTPASGTMTNVSGTAASLTAGAATVLATARTIGNVSFNGSANIVPETMAVIDSTDASSSIAMFDSATGNLQAKTDAGLSYNATTGMLTATGLTGPLTGNASTSTALAANGTNCSGSLPRGIDASGNAEGCADVDLTTEVTGTMPVANGGTGVATLTGLLQGNGTSAFTAITNSTTVGQILRVTGSNTYAWGALDLADTDAITGVLPIANGGSVAYGPPVRTSGTVLTLPAIAADSQSVGNSACTSAITAGDTFTVVSGTGTLWIARASDCSVVVRHNLTGTCSGCTAVGSSSGFADSDLPLYEWVVTSATLASNGTNRFLNAVSRPLVAGSNVSIVYSGGIATISSTGGGGGGGTGTAPYDVTFSSTTTTSTSAVTHGQGTKPTIQCFDSSEVIRDCGNSEVDPTTGDVSWIFPTAFSGIGRISGGGPGVAGPSTVSDSVLRIQDNGDATKQLAFEVSGITTATTRTVTVPDASGTLALTSSNVATATALATTRAIYGNNFDGTAALTQIIASTFGGTGNGFTKFSGATTSEKTYTLPNSSTTIVTIADTGTVTNTMLAGSIDLTAKVTGILPGANGGTGNGFFAATGPTTSLKTFTFPNASATVLTSNAAVTIAQGGTGTGSTLTGLMRGSASAMTAAELSGDVTTSGSNAATIAANAVNSSKMAVVNTRRVCDMVFGNTNGSALANGDLGPQKGICFIPYAATIVEIDVKADGGTPNIIVGTETGGSVTNVLSSALATAASGARACSKTTAVAGIDGTTCSATLQNTSITAGSYIEAVSGTAGGVAKLMTVHVVYTVN